MTDKPKAAELLVDDFISKTHGICEPEPYRKALIELVEKLLSSPALAAEVVRLEKENADKDNLIERLKIEAQCHAGEARTANATINEIYQLCSGATGEKANWNGSQPVKDALEKREKRVKELEKQLEWRPIEIVPDEIKRNGTVILAVTKERGGWCNTPRSTFYLNDAWDSFSDREQPTHWMPLPAPPAALTAVKE